ncbi:hypothetical protein [Shewanella acanthi]|uniref:hypothetical protein n=1 Tax=Shewanella acanthi TaxID=2864212 RepID=UPI001C65B7BC|nr:hypothetical protein [Shewanella acanthi]QYJ78752.1 hypothetical protein K0H61_17030 [Shewanella acanthi]
MLTLHLWRQRLAIILFTFIWLAVFSVQSLANQPKLESLTQSSNVQRSASQTTDSQSKAKALPLGTLLDSDGNPIGMPEERSALNYSSLTVDTPEATTKKAKDNTSTKSPKKKAKKPSRKQQLASREHIANDPSCRWLDARMDQLEGQISTKASAAAQYQSDELNVRQQEWRCLKCGAEGPERDDYYRCQYRR